MKTNEKSLKAYQKALSVLPGGVSSPVRAFAGIGVPPVVIQSSKGAYLKDADGHVYLDYCQSWGAHILGHGDREYWKMASHALQKGASYGALCEQEIEYANLLCSIVPTIERIRFVSSGTEAVMSCLRLARAFTKRDLIIKFDGCYHGHSDFLLVSAGSGLAQLNSQSSLGIPQNVTKNTISIPYNDLEKLKKIFQSEGEKIAAVIIEPIAANMGLVLPDDGFLQTLRDLTKQNGALLIFDEVITGFRIGPEGAQGYFSIKPDLSCFGKIIGGGMPAAAFGGRAEIMSMLAPLGNVYQAGTLSGNPVAMACGQYVIKKLMHNKSENDGPVNQKNNYKKTIYQRIEKLSEHFENGLTKLGQKHGFVLSVFKGMFSLFFTDVLPRNFTDVQKADHQKWNRLFCKLLSEGIYLSPSSYETNFINLCHNENNIDSTIKLITKCLKELDNEGAI